jgi:hypothetical protein
MGGVDPPNPLRVREPKAAATARRSGVRYSRPSRRVARPANRGSAARCRLHDGSLRIGGAMKVMIRLGCAVALVAVGWLSGHAQSVGQPSITEPQFVLEVEAPQGWTSVTCARGCELIGSRDHGNPQAGRMLEYQYGCGVGRDSPQHRVPIEPPPGTASPGLRCKATVYGWLRSK